MIHKLLLISTLSFIMIACGGDGRNGSFFDVLAPKGCSQSERNQFVYDVLKDSYFWSDKVGAMNISLEHNDSTFLDHFLHSEDRFSHILTKEVFEQQFSSGEAVDFGFLSALVEKSPGEFETKIAYVYADSPADNAGIIRSDIILSSTELANKQYQIRLRNSAGVERVVEIAEEEYAVSNVTHTSVFNVDEKRVGYFVFKSFVGPRLITNLNQTFSYLQSQNISDLVIDLRYNGGGLVHVAAHLGALIGGENVKGHTFQTNRYNAKYQQHNSSTPFAAIPSQSLHLKRIFFIMTQNSASASESLINALRASDNDIEVITIGTNSYGKPFGMHTMHYCDNVLIPIHFSDENSDGVGSFVDGLVPTCEVLEDFNNNFSDSNETLLNEALFYIQNGHCKL